MTREQWRKKISKTSKGFVFGHTTWKWEDVERIEGPNIQYDTSHIMTLTLHFKSGQKVFTSGLDNVYKEASSMFFGKVKKLITGTEYWDNKEHHNEKFKKAENSFEKLIKAYKEYISSNGKT